MRLMATKTDCPTPTKLKGWKVSTKHIRWQVGASFHMLIITNIGEEPRLSVLWQQDGQLMGSMLQQREESCGCSIGLQQEAAQPEAASIVQPGS